MSPRFTAARVWAAVEDWLIPTLRLNTHERAIYYHLVRRTRLDGRRTLRISRRKLARVSGLSTFTARHYLRSLARKHCIRFREHSPLGCLIEVRLPHEIRRRLARAPRSEQLLWSARPPELDASGQPRAWPRSTHAPAAALRARILLRDAFLDARSHRVRVGVPHPCDVQGWVSNRRSTPSRSQPRRGRLPHPCDVQGWVSGRRSSTRSPLRASRARRPRRDGVGRRAPRFKPRCFYCRRRLRPHLWTLDHIVPIARGGSDAPCNLVASCPSCNWQKALTPAEDFLHTLCRTRAISRRQLAIRLTALHRLATSHSPLLFSPAAEDFLRTLHHRRVISPRQLRLKLVRPRLKSLRALQM